MDLKLHREAPVFKRCCFCLPLRRGLIAWGYARLILNILTIIYFIMILIWLFHYVRSIYLSMYIAMVAFILVDVAFTGLLIFACHKKNFKLLRISYIYSIAWLILYMTSAGYGLIRDITRIYSIWDFGFKYHRFIIMDLVMTSAFIFTTVFIQVYVILLTRSEAIKLQNQSLEMEFVNNAGEAHARCVSAEQRCTDDGYTSVKYTDEKDNSAQYV